MCIIIEPHRVLIAFRWTDCPEGHGGAVGAWILERHRCVGQDLDCGTMLADNTACAAHLAQISCTSPSTPERVCAVLGARLVGTYLHSIEITWAVRSTGTVRAPKGRYIARPPLALDRLKQRQDGKILLTLKRPWSMATPSMALALCSLIQSRLSSGCAP